MINNKFFSLTYLFLGVLSGFIIILFIWFYYGQIDESVSGVGKIIPEGKVRRIMAPVDGIVSKVLVAENQHVKKGEVLVKLDTKLNEIQENSVKKQIDLVRKEINSLMNAQHDEFLNDNWARSVQQEYKAQLNSAKLQIVKSEYSYKQLQQEYTEAKQIFATTQNLFQKYTTLYKSGAISEREYKEYEQKLISQRSSLHSLEEELKIKQLEIKQANENKQQVVSNYNNYTYEKLNQNQKDLEKYNSEALKSELNKKYLEIKSPIEGIVNQQVIREKGEKVIAGDVILSIVPVTSPKVAEVKVLNKNMSYIKLNQDVFLKLEALPYQEYGRLNGVVKGISPSTVENKDGREVFIVKVAPKEEFLRDRKGAIHSIHSGMSVSADFITRKKNILSFILEPITEHLDKAVKEPTSR